MKIFGIAAGKGGVGKSTITVNLAHALKKKGYTVGILDADVYGPSIHYMLGVEKLPSESDNRITPAFSLGISYISIAFFREEGQANAVRAPIANDIINQFLEYVDWSSIDYLLIDFPPGTGDIPLTLAQKTSMSVILVTTPGSLSLLDVRKAAGMFNQMNIPIMGVIENMSYFQLSSEEKHHVFGTKGGEILSQEMGIPFLGKIPLDPIISQAVEENTTIFQKKEFSSTANLFFSIIDHILNQETNNGLKEFELIWNKDAFDSKN